MIETPLMSTSILDIMQQRVQKLAEYITTIETNIQKIHQDIANTTQQLTHAQQNSDLNQVRACLAKVKELQEQLPALEAKLVRVKNSHRLFSRQLEQNSR